MIEALLVALALGLVVGTVALAIEPAIPALFNWLHFLRSNEPDSSSAVATDSAVEADKQRLAELKTEPAEAETRTAERERQISAAEELARQEAALAQRLRNLERSLAEAERSASEARTRIEAQEKELAAQEARLRQEQSELANRQPSAAEPDSIRPRAGLSADEEDLRAVESDWWEKQLGRPLSAKE